MQALRLPSIMHSNQINIFLLILMLILFTSQARAGVVIGGSRFIINDNEKKLSFPVRNTSGEPYLITVKIKPASAWKGAISNAVLDGQIIATPPVFILKGNGDNIVNIFFLGSLKNYERDRESLFQLELSAIPSDGKVKDSLQVAVRSRFKLIFRPSTLKGRPNDSYAKLDWRREKDGISVSNPTPYVVTFYKLKIDNVKIPEAGVIMPYQTRMFSTCMHNSACKISWQTINDFGGVLPEINKSLE